MKYILLTIFLLIITVVISQVIVSKNTSETGAVPYETLQTYDGFEIRKYPELTVASTRLPQGSYSENSRLGFRRIASYIFGGNKSNTQIAMTSPVQMDMGDNSSMRFFMPPNMDIEDLPLPNNSSVSIQNQPSSTVAVIQFSGWASDKILEKKLNELRTLLRTQDIEFEDNYAYLGYNPPYQLINRLNEVVIKLKNYENK
jgi:hypothetical protein